MENAHPINDEAGAPGTGAPIVALGAFPARKATVTADVLACLLSGERMTGLDAVADSSTTRLAAVVFYLTDEYGWPIERRDKAAGCKDGRIAWVSEYFMAPEVLACAGKAGAAAWTAQVRAARRSLRFQAARSRAKAQRLNRATKATHTRDIRQRGLFGEGDAA